MNVLWIEDDKKNIEGGLEQICGAIGCYDYHNYHDNQIKTDLPSFLKKLGEEKLVNIEWINKYYDASKCIHENYSDDKWDVVILDLDLTEGFSNKYQDDDEYVEATKAGFTLYFRLLQKSFPHENICFFTGNEDVLKDLQNILNKYGLPKPKVFCKSQSSKFEEWLKGKFYDKNISLRRGIINACKELTKEKTKEKTIDQEEAMEWLEALPNLVSIHHDHWRKSFIFLLLIHWDAKPNTGGEGGRSEGDSKYLYRAIFNTLKTSRNWSAHNKLKLNSPNTEYIVAFLFILCMRSVFKINQNIQNYEKILLNTFSQPSEEQSIELSRDFLCKKYNKIFSVAVNLLKFRDNEEVKKVPIYKSLEFQIESIRCGKKFYSKLNPNPISAKKGSDSNRFIVRSYELLNIINNIQEDALCECLLPYSVLIDAAGNFNVSNIYSGEYPEIMWNMENISQDEHHWFSHLKKHIIG